MESPEKESWLDRTYRFAQIFALIGTPVVVAIVSWSAQKSAVEISTSKDYVQIAVQVLRDPLKEDTEAAKAWAVGIIQKYSPVPFSPEAGRQLSRGAIAMLDNHPLLTPAMTARPPCNKIDLTKLSAPLASEVAQLYAQCTANQSDLLWLRTYVKLITDPAPKPDQSKTGQTPTEATN
jgi:hypothetical protein